MRSANRTIDVTKAVNLGHMPAFISFMHKHLEKENGGGTRRGLEVAYTVPVDLLQLTVDDPSLVREIESVTLTYRAK